MTESTNIGGLEADRAAAQLMPGVERVHHATDLASIRWAAWTLLGAMLLMIPVGIYLGLDGLPYAFVLAAVGLLGFIATRRILVNAFSHLETAIVVRRQGIVALSRGKITREIPWFEIIGFEEVDSGQDRAHWLLQVRDGDHLPLRADSPTSMNSSVVSTHAR
ncbi:MAG TPA: hypothetical protein QGF05_11385 [Dehalococcoidia bacterium]|nr:hypothetical protein [Dehalococcoidia bacterium]